MTPKRFLFIIARGDSFGGSSKHVRDLAARLEKDGHRARILVGGDESMEVPRRFAARGVDYRCVSSLERSIHLVRDFRALGALRREIRVFGPDLVSTHSSKGGAIGRLACAGLGIPVLYTPHCWSFVEGFPGARLFRLIERGLAPLTTKIVAVSKDERRFGLSRGVGRPGQTVVVHNGIEDYFGCVRESNAPGGPVRIVMVGRFEEQKDQPLLLRALGRLRDLGWRLTLVGDGPLKDACRELAENLGIPDRVEFAGYSDRVEDFLKEADLFVLITHWEGFPRSILEAMRAGLPVIATDVGGCRESVKDGNNGLLVPRGDLDALAGALRSLLADDSLREAMGERGRERFAGLFTFEHMYRNYRRLYASLLAAVPEKETAAAPDRAIPRPVDSVMKSSLR